MSPLLVCYRKPCRGVALQTECCSQERKYSCSKALRLHPGGVSHTSTIRIPVLKLFGEGDARTKPAALGKRRLPCSQTIVPVPGPSLELRPHLGAVQSRGRANSSFSFPNTVYNSYLSGLQGSNLLQKNVTQQLPPRTAAVWALMGRTSLSCPAAVGPPCEHKATVLQGSSKMVPGLAGALLGQLSLPALVRWKMQGEAGNGAPSSGYQG